MAAVVYPPSLPGPSSYPFAPRERRAASQTPGRTELRSRSRETLVDASGVRWVYSPAEMAAWRSWFEDTLLHGRRWFSAALPGRGGWQERTARYIGNPRREHLGAGHWAVTADLEVSPRAAPQVPEPETPIDPGVGFRFDPASKDAIFTLSDEDRRATLQSSFSASAGRSASVQGTISGKRYIEFALVSQVSVQAAFGINSTANRIEAFFNTGSWGVTNGSGCSVSPGLYINGVSTPNAAYSFAVGDVMGFAVDAATGKVWVSKNGVFVVGNPAAGTGESFTLPAGTYCFFFGTYTCLTSTGALAADVLVTDAELGIAPPAGFLSYSGG